MLQALIKEFTEHYEYQLNGGKNDGEIKTLLAAIRDEANAILDDGKQQKLEVLALLEAYRLYVDSNPKKAGCTDHVVRICQAIIAKVFGYDSRALWSEGIQSAGLIDYERYMDTAEHFERYKKLTEIVDNIRL